jgi:hypothetical protein
VPSHDERHDDGNALGMGLIGLLVLVLLILGIAALVKYLFFK